MAQSASAVEPSKCIITHKIPFMRLDVRSVVVAVISGVVATALLHLAEYADTALFGWMLLPLSILCMSTTSLVVAYLYGPIAAVIAVEIHPLGVLITASDPLPWFWFLTNFFYIFPAGWMMMRLQPMDRWWKWSIASLAGALPAFLSLLPIQLYLWSFPLWTALLGCAFHILWEFLGPSTAAMFITKAFGKAGMIP